MADNAYSGSIYIDAEPDFVFEYFTNAESLVRWMGDRAVLEPYPGGRFTVVFGERRVEGRYVEIDRPRRLVISWGRSGSKELPPYSSHLEITFDAQGRGTKVSITHSGLPDSELIRHSQGWDHYLARLSEAALGRDLGRHVTPAELTEGAD